MNKLLIRNARLVNEGREFEGDLRVTGDRIEQIGTGLAAREGETVHDAAGRWLLPGVIDAQVAIGLATLVDHARVADQQLVHRSGPSQGLSSGTGS